MKKVISKSRLFRFLNRLLYGKNPSNLSKTEKKKILVENKLRWEDDGGPILEVNDSMRKVDEDGGEKQSLPD